jgi:hypothetical protein
MRAQRFNAWKYFLGVALICFGGAVAAAQSSQSKAIKPQALKEQMWLAQAFGAPEQVLLWRWQATGELKYRIRYDLAGKQKIIDAKGLEVNAASNGLRSLALKWQAPDQAKNIILQQYEGKRLVAESEPVSPVYLKTSEAGQRHQHHSQMDSSGHTDHQPPGKSSAWMFKPAVSKAAVIEPKLNDQIPVVSCPAGTTDSPFGAEAPRGCPPTPPSIGDPISLTDGSFWLNIPCFNLGGAGREITFNIHYDTHKWADMLGYTGLGSGPEAFGWVGSYSRRLTIDNASSRVIIILEDGAWKWWNGNSSSGFVRGPGNYANLNFNSPNQEYTVSYISGEKDIFNAAGMLKRVEDRVGNSSLVSDFVIGADGLGRRTITNNRTNQSLILEHTDINNQWRLSRVVESGAGIITPRQMSFTFGSSGPDANRLVRIVDTAGRSYGFNYDLNP